MENPFDNSPFSRGTRQIEVNPLKIRRTLQGAFALILVLFVVAGVISSIFTVEPEGKAVVKRFGKVIAIRGPGLHFKLPFLIDRAYFVPTERVMKEEFGFRTMSAQRRTQYHKGTSEQEESLMLTGDLNVIDVEWVVQYRIKDPDRFLHRVRDPFESIRDVSEAVMRRITGNRMGSDVLTVGRVEVAALARDEIQKILDTYDMGVHISTVELQDVTPPEPVKPAFNQVNEARQEKERLVNEAEKRRNQAIPKAKGEALQIISEAEGYAAERINMAKGEAARFEAILKEYKDAPDVTCRRLYIETMTDVLSKIDRIYVVEEGQVAPLPLLNLNDKDKR